MAKRKRRRAIGALAQIKEKYNSLPAPVQYGIIGLGALLAYRIIFVSPQERSNAEVVKGAGDELKESLKTQKLTYAPSQYPGYANQIYEGTKYGIGDNYSMVAKVFMFFLFINLFLDLLIFVCAKFVAAHFIFAHFVCAKFVAC